MSSWSFIWQVKGIALGWWSKTFYCFVPSDVTNNMLDGLVKGKDFGWGGQLIPLTKIFTLNQPTNKNFGHINGTKQR